MNTSPRHFLKVGAVAMASTSGVSANSKIVSSAASGKAADKGAGDMI
jgi:hypothetical protein